MASRVTLDAEEEGAEVEGVKEEGGIAEVARSIVSIHGCFGRSWASLCRMGLAHMAPTKMGDEVVSRHGLETFTVRVVRMCYPRDV